MKFSKVFGLAPRPAVGHGRAGHHVLPRHLLPVGLPVPPAAEGHPPSQADQEEGSENDRLFFAKIADSVETGYIKLQLKKGENGFIC